VSQSRFSIVLVGVSALLRRPLVSRLRPADGERSSWVVFAARGCRFDSGFRWAGWPSGSLLPLFGMHRFGVAAGRVGSSAFRFGVALGGLVFGLIASAFRHAPIRGGRWASSFFRLPLRKLPSAGWPSGSPLPLFGTHRFGDCRWAGWPSDSLLPLFGTRRFGDCRSAVGLRAHCFRFSARTASEIALGGLLLPPSASEIALGGLAFGLTVSAFRHAPLRSGCWASSFFRLPLRRFRSTGWSSGSLLPLFGMHRFGVALGGLAFGLTASDFRHAPIRSGRWAVGLRAYCFGDCHLAGWPLGSPLRRLPSAGWPSGSLLPLFGTHRFGDCPRRVGLRAHCFRFSACADPHRRAAEARTDGAQRHDNCFTSKHLSQHVNLPHRTP